MIYIQIDSNSNVIYQHNMPFDSKYGLGKTENELKTTGILTDEIFPAENITGKSSTLKWDGSKMYWEYFTTPVSPKIDLEGLQEQIIQTNKDNISTMEAIADVYEMLLGGV